jgi:hypothetical protein
VIFSIVLIFTNAILVFLYFFNFLYRFDAVGSNKVALPEKTSVKKYSENVCKSLHMVNKKGLFFKIAPF